MEHVPLTNEVVKALRKAKAEGKELSSFQKKLLGDANAREGRVAGRGKLAGALYILGASLNQMARRFDIKTGTIWTYVRQNVPEGIRKLASQQRDYGRAGVLCESYMIEAYCTLFEEKKEAMRGMNSVQIAALLQQALGEAIKPAPESLDAVEPGDPYA